MRKSPETVAQFLSTAMEDFEKKNKHIYKLYKEDLNTLFMGKVDSSFYNELIDDCMRYDLKVIDCGPFLCVSKAEKNIPA